MLHKKIILTVSIMLLVMAASFLNAEEKDQTLFNGNFFIGYRMTDISGTETKYKEDFNLYDGARLMNFEFSLTPAPGSVMKTMFDNVTVALTGFGGDPFEALSVNVIKYGAYSFNYKRQKAAYFYEDILFPKPWTYDQMRADFGGDAHHFNFERVMDSAALKIWLGSQMHFYLNFDRYTRKGSSTTTLDLLRDEFELEKSMDQSSKEVTLGLDYRNSLFTVAFEERIRDYKDDGSYFLPGFSEGDNYGYTGPKQANFANLSDFFWNMPYDMTSLSHTLRLTIRPNSNFLIKTSVNYMTLRINDLNYNETLLGQNSDKSKAAYTYLGNGTMWRDLWFYNADLSYLLSDKLAIVGGVRYSKLQQDGTLNYVDNTSTTYTLAANADDYHTMSVDGGVQFQMMSDLTLTAGLRYEDRRINSAYGQDKTTRTGLFGNAAWNCSKTFSLTADYQYGDYVGQDIPTAPSTYQRLRINARYKLAGFFANGSYLLNRVKNDQTLMYHAYSQGGSDNFLGNNQQINARVGYNDASMMISLGYSLMVNDYSGDARSVEIAASAADTAAPMIWPLFYYGTVNMFDGFLQYNVSKDWSLGMSANVYTAPTYYTQAAKNSGTIDWQISRTILKPFVEVNLGDGLSTRIAYMYIFFKDQPQQYNRYTANLLELSIGYKW